MEEQITALDDMVVLTIHAVIDELRSKKNEQFKLVAALTRIGRTALPFLFEKAQPNDGSC